MHQVLRESLLNLSGKVPLHERFRALFSLRGLGDDESVQIISECFCDPSVLLKHELAYCLGQMQNSTAISVLERVLANEEENSMVRHEAAEALGALGSASSIKILEKYSHDASVVVQETCQLALERIQRSLQKGERIEAGKIYDSVDPAPPGNAKLSVCELGKVLLDCTMPLYERYKAMFALRDKGGEDAVLELVKGLFDTSSALFRHEIAYVLGQMQHPASVPGLIKCLEIETEVDMVRHECAEALGSVATDQVLSVLQKYRNDNQVVVKESCEVALDMYDYEMSNQLHYATMK